MADTQDAVGQCNSLFELCVFGCLLFCLSGFSLKDVSKQDVFSLIQRIQKDWHVIEEPSKCCVKMCRPVLLLTGFQEFMIP